MIETIPHVRNSGQKDPQAYINDVIGDHEKTLELQVLPGDEKEQTDRMVQGYTAKGRAPVGGRAPVKT